MKRRGAAAAIPAGRTASAARGSAVTPGLMVVSLILASALSAAALPVLSGWTDAGMAPKRWMSGILALQLMGAIAALYAHLLGKIPRLRHQIGLHLALWIVCTGALPIEGDLTGALPAPLDTPLYRVGPAVVFLASTAFLIQTLYGRTRGPSSIDPFFLSGLACAGSLVGLLGAIFALQHEVPTPRLAGLWSIGFVVLGLLLFASALSSTREHPDARTVLPVGRERNDLRLLGKWASLAFLPMAALIGILGWLERHYGSTFYTGWSVFALYLLSFAGGFKAGPSASDTVMRWTTPLALGALLIACLMPAPPTLIGFAGCMAFTILALNMHRRLYQLRPGTARLTVFHLATTVGSAAGAIVMTLIAPRLFPGDEALILLIPAAAAALLGFRPGAAGLRSALSGLASSGLLLALSIDPDLLTSASSVALGCALLSVAALAWPAAQRVGLTGLLLSAGVLLAAGAPS